MNRILITAFISLSLHVTSAIADVSLPSQVDITGPGQFVLDDSLPNCMWADGAAPAHIANCICNERTGSAGFDFQDLTNVNEPTNFDGSNQGWHNRHYKCDIDGSDVYVYSTTNFCRDVTTFYTGGHDLTTLECKNWPDILGQYAEVFNLELGGSSDFEIPADEINDYFSVGFIIPVIAMVIAMLFGTVYGILVSARKQ